MRALTKPLKTAVLHQILQVLTSQCQLPGIGANLPMAIGNPALLLGGLTMVDHAAAFVFPSPSIGYHVEAQMIHRSLPVSAVIGLKATLFCRCASGLTRRSMICK